MHKLPLLLILVLLLLASPAAAVLHTEIDKPKPAEPDAHASTTTVANLSSRVDAVSNKVDAVGNEVDRLSDNRTTLEATNARVDALENANPAPVNIYVTPQSRAMPPLPPKALAMLNEKLAPQMRVHMAAVNAGKYTQEDVAFLVAGYNTDGDHSRLAKFCARMLSGRYPLGRPGFRDWLLEQCSAGER